MNELVFGFMNTSKMYVVSLFSENLALRDSARELFSMIEENDSVIVDFAGVRSLSRSFAHEYLTRKKLSSKNIEDVNVPIVVKKMFDAVKNPKAKQIIKLQSLKPITV